MQKGLAYGVEVQAITFAGVFIGILLTAVMIPLLKTSGLWAFYDTFLDAFPAVVQPASEEVEDAEALSLTLFSRKSQLL